MAKVMPGVLLRRTFSKCYSKAASKSENGRIIELFWLGKQRNMLLCEQLEWVVLVFMMACAVH